MDSPKSSVSFSSLKGRGLGPTELQRLRPRPYRRYNSASSEYEKDEPFTMADEEFLARVSLETAQIGPWRYISRDYGEDSIEPEDIELLYERGTNDLVIKTAIGGTNKAVPATFRIKSVSAADLALFSVVPGSLESMVTRLVLESDENISCLPHMQKQERRGEGEEEEGRKEGEGEGEGEGEKKAEEEVGEGGEKREGEGGIEEVKTTEKVHLNVHMVRLTASVHEAGHLRDILHFKNSPNDLSLSLENIREKLTFKEEKEEEGEGVIEEESKEQVKPLTLLEGLPNWVLYVPWMLYSRKTRIFIQRLLFLYTVFSVLWAMWQLYRHVNIIRIVIQPIIAALRYHLSPVIEMFDWVFAVFTVWWHTLLSPLNVLRGFLLAPMLQAFTHFKWMIYPIYTSLSQLLSSTGLASALVSLSTMLQAIVQGTGTMLWYILLKPMFFVWQSFLNARVAVKSVDFQNMRLRLAFGLVSSSVRSIYRGLWTFVGYTRKEKRIQRATKAYSTTCTPVVSPASTPGPSSASRRRSDMPMIYSSPLSKQQ